MTAKYALLAIGLLIIESIASPVSWAAPAPKEKPVITCELKVTGKDGELISPYAGEVTITNNSNETIDIGTTMGPLGFLDLKVRDPNGDVVKTKPLASLRSPSFKVTPHMLKAGESYRAPLGLLLFVVPKEKRVVGTYKVKGVFKFQEKVYESAEVEVKWTGEDK